jgi:hypothetical protein
VCVVLVVPSLVVDDVSHNLDFRHGTWLG